jgi:ubiquinone/menaquinone biosynthesis C-methylase UbiE
MDGHSSTPPDTLARLRHAWDAAAPHFDAEPGHRLSEPVRAAWRRLLGPAFARLGGDRPLQIVEVGAGTGEMSMLLAGMGHAVTAVDISPAMLARAGNKARERGLQVHFMEAPADAMHVQDGGADVVFARDVLWALPDPHAALREWYRILRAGGMVAVADGWWNPPDPMARTRRRIGSAVRQVLEWNRPPTLARALAGLDGPLTGGVSAYSIRYYLDTAGFERLRVRDLAAIRAATRGSLPLWRWIDQPQYTWLATGFKPEAGPS